MLNAAMSIVNAGSGRNWLARISTGIRHNIGKKYFIALSQDFFNSLLVVAIPACFAFHSPVMRSMDMANNTAP